MYFLIRVLINAAGLWVATLIIPGISVTGSNMFVTLLIVAIIFGVVNAVIKPILAMLTCPLYILSLGLFTFVVNALMLLLTSGIAGALRLGFQVDGFLTALLGAIVVSVVSFLLSVVIREERRL
jgi:putative membrane protein